MGSACSSAFSLHRLPPSLGGCAAETRKAPWAGRNRGPSAAGGEAALSPRRRAGARGAPLGAPAAAAAALAAAELGRLRPGRRRRVGRAAKAPGPPSTRKAGALDRSRREVAAAAPALALGTAAAGSRAGGPTASGAAEGGGVAGVWRRFPEGFAWGTATAAFQIEGAALEAGKGPSIWDTFSHVPGNIFEEQNAAVACDHFRRYKEDVALLRAMGSKFYRFSISWPRVLPRGTLAGGVNEAGLQFYDDLLAELRANGIEPIVTLYHWDLPQALEDLGGWLDRSVVDAFRDYARLCFQRFGGSVRRWCTLNEPWTQCVVGYVFGSHAPGRSAGPGTEPYLAGHHMLLAHAAAVKVFRGMSLPGAQIAIVLNTEWYEPQDPSNAEDVAATERALAFCLGWFADPIYKGDYPAVMRERCGERLPAFSAEEKGDLLGSNDFFAINSYSARYVCEDNVLRNFLNTPATLKILPFVSSVAIDKLKAGLSAAAAGASGGEPAGAKTGDGAVPRGGPALPAGVPATSYVTDAKNLTVVPLDAELNAMGWPVAHYGLGRLLSHIQRAYPTPGGIFVTEAGTAFPEEDPGAGPKQRAYLERQALVVRRAIEDGADVRGYLWWTLMDNFEWSAGYSKKFGLFSVDFASGSLARRPREAAVAFQALAERNAVSDTIGRAEFDSCLRRPDGK